MIERQSHSKKKIVFLAKEGLWQKKFTSSTYTYKICWWWWTETSQFTNIKTSIWAVELQMKQRPINGWKTWWIAISVFPKIGGTSISHPKMIISSRKNPWLLGKPTVFGNTHISTYKIDSSKKMDHNIYSIVFTKAKQAKQQKCRVRVAKKPESASFRCLKCKTPLNNKIK